MSKVKSIQSQIRILMQECWISAIRKPFYRTLLMQEATQQGYPLVRHLFLHYPNDSNVLEIDKQWLLGSDILVAPVTDQGSQQVDVYLPKGKWIHVWSGEEFDHSKKGAWVVIQNAIIGQPPVFYLEGSSAGEKFVSNLKQAGVL